MRMFKPEFIPRILLSLILFGLGTSFLLFAAPGCACPEVTLGQPVSPSPIYPVWELTLAVLLIGAGIFVLVLQATNQSDCLKASRPQIPHQIRTLMLQPQKRIMLVELGSL